PSLVPNPAAVHDLFEAAFSWLTPDPETASALGSVPRRRGPNRPDYGDIAVRRAAFATVSQGELNALSPRRNATVTRVTRQYEGGREVGVADHGDHGCRASRVFCPD